ncbi:MAG: beta-lactamase [Saprospiraceae bacterium]|nr:MAG: beta-lactamase [Saprospiraceae bacterium]
MKYIQLVPLLFIICSCADENPQTQTTEVVTTSESKEVVKPEFQAFIDSAKVAGAILIYDPQQKVYYSNDFNWAKQGQLPASTFKIPNSIIGLETGVVKNDSTLFKWDGKKRYLSVWERDMIFRDAFHLSCVPCYQEIARNIGTQRMKEYVKKFDYGNVVVDSATIDQFWLEGNSKISPFQQIAFLQRFYTSKLSISERTYQIMKRLMVMDKNDAYQLSGKTGWSIVDGHNNGWFVGYMEQGDQVYYFATNVEPLADMNMDDFPGARKVVTMKGLEVVLGNGE